MSTDAVNNSTRSTGTVDLSTCDREPIHIPGSVQPHGVLLALDAADLKVLQASRNADALFAESADAILGRPLDALIDADLRHALGPDATELASLDTHPSFVGTLQLRGKQYDVVGHCRDGVIVLEFEPAATSGGIGFRSLYASVRAFVRRLRGMSTVEELAQLAAEEARRITGFDRVLTYQFDDTWNGQVIAEARDEEFTSYLGLHFPASDIPAQARQLYALNPFRLIADAGYRPAPLVPGVNPKTGRPLDLTFSHLRSVSPVHVEYLHNMGIVASMSISVFQGDRLWGLISCHHKTPRHLSYEVRTACEFLGQVLSVQLEEKTRNAEVSHRASLRSIQTSLLTAMSEEEDFVDGLVRREADLLNFGAAGGAAVASGDRLALLGVTPDEAQVRRLIQHLAERVGEEVFATDTLADVFPEAREYVDKASGLLAVSVSKLHRGYVLWFRPELVKTVRWGGDPRKPVDPEPGQIRLHPRKSFEAWKETVRGKSMPWRDGEAEAAVELRNAIVGIVLRKAEELAALSSELQRSNKELEAFSYSVSHDLRAPFRHIVGYSELLREQVGPTLDQRHQRWVDTIIESAQHAGKLVDNLLSFSQMGRSSLTMRPIDMDVMFDEVVKDVNGEASGRPVRWDVAGGLPPVQGDPNMLRLALRNLLSNAVKYTRKQEQPFVEVGCDSAGKEHVFFVRDNGAGFDMRYVNKLFGVFQRLHRIEEFEGTGIGLANVRRIVARHGGRTWAQGALNQGATFFFSLPKTSEAS